MNTKCLSSANVIYDLNGNMLLCSRSIITRFGYSDEGLLERSIVELLAENCKRNLDLFLCEGSVWGILAGEGSSIGPEEIAVEELELGDENEECDKFFIACIQSMDALGEKDPIDREKWEDGSAFERIKLLQSIDVVFVLRALSLSAQSLNEGYESGRFHHCFRSVLAESVLGEVTKDKLTELDGQQLATESYFECLRKALSGIGGVKIGHQVHCDNHCTSSQILLPTKYIADLALSLVSSIVLAADGGKVSVKLYETEASFEISIRFSRSQSVDGKGIQRFIATVGKDILEDLFLHENLNSKECGILVRIPVVQNKFTEVENDVGNGEAYVLVVEDNDLNSEILCYFLRDRGYRYDVADNGCKAVEMYGINDYDIVLMDVMLPEMSGYEATERILAMKGGEETPPIIGVTAKAFRDDLEKCFEVGMSEVVHKPIDFDKLDVILKAHLYGGEAQGLELQRRAEKRDAATPANGVLDEKVAKAFVRRMTGLDGEPSRVVDRVMRELDSGYERLLASVKKGDAAEIERCAHSLKGSLGLIGSTDAYDLARGLEVSASQDEGHFRPQHWSDLLKAALDQVGRSLREMRFD